MHYSENTVVAQDVEHLNTLGQKNKIKKIQNGESESAFKTRTKQHNPRETANTNYNFPEKKYGFALMRQSEFVQLIKATQFERIKL